MTEGSVDPVPLFRIDWTAEEVGNAVDSITRGSYWANGPYVDEFESLLAETMGVEHAVVFNSGTSALVGALEGCDIGPGDEVIVPSFTFIATANAVEAVGATPVFAEIDRDRYALDPDDVADRITDSTAAIMPIHYAGIPCRIEALRELARDHDLTLIEDAAEAQGATVNGAPVGTAGDAGVLSFCQNKVITTGEGGAVVTDDDELAARLEQFRSHGRVSGEYFDSADTGEYVSLGFNLRMPDVVAGIGVAQIERIDDIVARRREVATDLNDRLATLDHVHPPAEPPDGRNVYQLYTVRFDPAIDRDRVIDELAERGIASKVYFDPVHLTQYYRDQYGYTAGELPRTEAISEQVLSLPMHPSLSRHERDRIVTALEEALDACGR
ncbi:DegT/DnrJ/EryC1/StrS family aminotransferase [Haloarcula salinisoli]|uniref:DegT/DnrJ/EryC1/StrS family aminotransferase n=1 Tax=Haloarcula salinisoli TaxID=2487746 RepID=A0A8J7YP88_9EURY|nr:DegT/DnrJ/EryC1/StrS family aminotransferase [Halomicroarcula salinisoli]MBX0305406.1 DegT/DnrJ/EryC1/StrS family aminotransferase [Halomicroarcula salinisoli]